MATTGSLLCFLDHNVEVNTAENGQRAYLCPTCGYVGVDVA